MFLKIIYKNAQRRFFATNNQGLDFDQAITFINIFLN
ncbi:hypothetical protein HPPN135_02065 [Helicobacter pylori Puno135]|nr:hypothetical protein HPPN135_02065 [Helicobacter pylori Puno135]